MKVKYVAAAAAMAFAGSAFAVNADLGTLGSGSFGNFFGSATPFFSDTFTFELTTDSTVSGLTGSSGIGTWGLVVLDSMFATVATDSTPASFSFSLGAGSYALQVVGFGAGAGSFYGGSISAAPVPEPETYAMMLAGLGMIGFMAARRSRR